MLAHVAPCGAKRSEKWEMETAKKHFKTQDSLMVGGLCWPILRAMWAHLGAILAHLGGHVGPSWGYVGPSWGYLGPSWGLGWPMLGLCWSILRPMLAHVDPS